MKRKKPTVGPNEIALDVNVVEKMADALQTATQAIEIFGGYLLTSLDTALTVSPERDDMRDFRASVAETVRLYRESRPSVEVTCESLRTLVAMKRSQVARGSERVM